MNFLTVIELGHVFVIVIIVIKNTATDWAARALGLLKYPAYDNHDNHDQDTQASLVAAPDVHPILTGKDWQDAPLARGVWF